MEIKDYEDEEELDPKEFDRFSGAIIVMAMILGCVLMVMLSLAGVL